VATDELQQRQLLTKHLLAEAAVPATSSVMLECLSCVLVVFLYLQELPASCQQRALVPYGITQCLRLNQHVYRAAMTQALLAVLYFLLFQIALPKLKLQQQWLSCLVCLPPLCIPLLWPCV
jgi:hypothetical protein